MPAPQGFWHLAPKYSDNPAAEVRAAGIPVLPMIYMAEGVNILRTDMPHLVCMRDKQCVFDKRKCQELARFLRANGVQYAVFDFEPSAVQAGGTPGLDGFTPENRETAEWIQDEFAASDVTLDFWGTPLTGDTIEWMAKRCRRRLYFVGYSMGILIDEWWETRSDELLKARNRVNKSMCGWISPNYSGDTGGTSPKSPPFGTPLPTYDFLRMMEFVEKYCNLGCVWADAILPDGSGYRKWDRKEYWWLMLQSRSQPVPPSSQVLNH